VRAKGPTPTKAESREEADRLIKEAIEKKGLTITQMKRRIEAKCRKCGAPNRAMAEDGETRVPFKCKECGEKQMTL